MIFGKDFLPTNSKCIDSQNNTNYTFLSIYIKYIQNIILQLNAFEKIYYHIYF